MRELRRILSVIWVLGALVFAVPGMAQTGDDLPLLLTADEVRYDRELGVITAEGNVEVVREDRIVLADIITYNQKTEILTASGNVSLTEPTGEVIFAQHVELTGDLKDGIVEDLRIILSDGALFAAAGARRSGGNTLEMRRGVYSACKLDPDDPNASPLWQVKALRLIHDKKRQTIEYRDAWLEIAGFPVAYTPYLSHPDPTVKRRSGFLVPSFGGSSDLGTIIKVPYYVNISDSADVTVTPIYTSKEGPVLFNEYRHRTFNGSLDLDASLTEDSDDDIRGHVRGEFRYDVSDTWRVGADVDRASDDTYLRRYGFGSKDTLTSRLFAEGFRKRNYMVVNGYTFQGLREEDDFETTPIVLPMIDYNHIGEADRWGGRTSLDINLMALTRTEGAGSRRLSVDAEWERPFVSPIGDLYTLNLSMRGDLYHVDNVVRTPQQSKFTGLTGRAIPQVSLAWRYPFVRDLGSIYQLLEPLGTLAYSPYGGNPNKIPNEDSTDFELDEINLFSGNRFTGLDRVEGGPRFSYGLRGGVYGSKGGNTSFLIGQSFRPKTDDTFAEGSGLEDKFSDIVARVHAAPNENFDLLYRARFASENFSPRRNEVKMKIGTKALNLNVDYVFFGRQADSEFDRREQVSGTLASQLTHHWSATLSGVRDLSDGGAMRSAGAGLTYEDCCFIFDTSISRNFFEDRDIEPTDSISIRLTFKTIGAVASQVQ